MKKLLFLLIIVFSALHFAHATSKEMLKYVPQNALFVVGADFQLLRACDVFNKLEKEGRIWSFDRRNDFTPLLNALKIQPAEVQSSVFTKYLNSYGAKGEFHLFEINRDLGASLETKPSTPYLSFKLYRLSAQEDLFATMLDPRIVAVGGLNGVKMALDVIQLKEKAIKESAVLKALYEKVPAGAGVWGISRPLSRKEAATRNADQSTNTMLEAFEHYYFFGVPTRPAIRAHFVGLAKGESEATFVRTFMVGMLTFSKFRAETEQLADALDQINVERNGKNIHVTAVVNNAMVDAYLKGELEVE